MPHVDLVDVAAAYERTRVLDGVSFGVEKGQIASLIGPSGSGKSTVLRPLPSPVSALALEATRISISVVVSTLCDQQAVAIDLVDKPMPAVDSP